MIAVIADNIYAAKESLQQSATHTGFLLVSISYLSPSQKTKFIPSEFERRSSSK
jgi:hypothetical protein